MNAVNEEQKQESCVNTSNAAKVKSKRGESVNIEHQRFAIEPHLDIREETTIIAAVIKVT